MGVLTNLEVGIPFSNFEGDILKEINISPSQLHPNSGAFMRVFKILNDILEFVLIVGIFLTFTRQMGLIRLVGFI